MSKILYSALVSDMRGKLNGSVHSRNKGGAIMRTKSTPVNPSTVYQQLQRSMTSQIAKAWTYTLNDAQRQTWVEFGKQAGALSVFGASLILAGHPAMQAVNRIVLNCGGTLVTTAPNNKNVTSLLTATLTANHIGPVLSLTFTPTPIVAPQGLYLFATQALSPGITNVTTQLRFIGFVSAAASPLNILTLWQARFGTFPASAGKRIVISAHVADSTTGAITPAFGASTLII